MHKKNIKISFPLIEIQSVNNLTMEDCETNSSKEKCYNKHLVKCCELKESFRKIKKDSLHKIPIKAPIKYIIS